MIFTFLSASAQQIWTEGTTWEVSIDYSDDVNVWTKVHTFELGEPVSFNDTTYYTLTETCEGVTNVISYLRAEGDDAYVYARQFQSAEFGINTGESSEILLYDFSKPFDYGDSIRYATYGGWMEQCYIDPACSGLSYLYDVIEPGDCLPMFQDIVYKIGSIYGPIANIQSDDRKESSPTGTPNTRNVSHVLFKTKGKPSGSTITLRIDVVRDASGLPLPCYSLMGIWCPNADCRVMFRKNNVLLKR